MIRHADVVAETRESAVRAAVSPGWVHPCEPQHQVLDLVALWQPAGPCLRVTSWYDINGCCPGLSFLQRLDWGEDNWDALSRFFSGFGRT